MIEAPHFSPAGSRKGSTALPEAFFDGTVHESSLHQAVTTYLANQRQGTHMTKTRSFVSGGNQKPWKQKGTGRARAGSTRSPLWPGGGTTFGPQPRDYRMGLPRKVKQLARKSALNARASEGALIVVERFDLESPKTARVVELLEAMGVGDKKALLLTHGLSQALVLSARNLPRVDVLPYQEASAYDVLWAEVVIVEEAALSGEPAVPFVRPFVPGPKTAPAVRTERPAKEKPAKEAKAKAAPKAKAAKATRKAKAAKTSKPAAKKSAKAPRAKAAKPAPKKKKKGGK
jgi:large subunit ribosomal protein L4